MSQGCKLLDHDSQKSTEFLDCSELKMAEVDYTCGCGGTLFANSGFTENAKLAAFASRRTNTHTNNDNTFAQLRNARLTSQTVLL